MGMFSQLMANESNERIAKQNLDYQRETFEYEKALQKQIFDREDTSYQRTVSDMQKAGLNPLTMSGTNGAGEAISMDTPQNSQHVESLQALESVGQIFNLVNQANTIKNNSTLADAQASLLNAQARNQSIKNLFETDLLSLDKVGKQFSNLRNQLEYSNMQLDSMFNEHYGLTNNMPDYLKQSLIMSGKRGMHYTLKSILDPWNDDTKSLQDMATTISGFGSLPDLNKTELSTSIIENKLLAAVPTILGKLFGGIF